LRRNFSAKERAAQPHATGDPPGSREEHSTAQGVARRISASEEAAPSAPEASTRVTVHPDGTVKSLPRAHLSNVFFFIAGTPSCLLNLSGQWASRGVTFGTPMCVHAGRDGVSERNGQTSLSYRVGRDCTTPSWFDSPNEDGLHCDPPE